MTQSTMTKKTTTPAWQHYVSGFANYSSLWVAGGGTLEPVSFSHSWGSGEGKA